MQQPHNIVLVCFEPKALMVHRNYHRGIVQIGLGSLAKSQSTLGCLVVGDGLSRNWFWSVVRTVCSRALGGGE